MIVSRKDAESAAADLGLHLHDTLDDVTVTMAYRALAKVVHPDVGGSPEAFAAVDRAKHVLMAWLARARPAPERPHGDPCHKCEGKGYIMLRRAFREMRSVCPACRGAGELPEREKGENM